MLEMTLLSLFITILHRQLNISQTETLARLLSLQSLLFEVNAIILHLDLKLLKILVPKISHPLATMTNQSFLNSIFPSKLKIAKVVPILKKWPRNTLQLQTNILLTYL